MRVVLVSPEYATDAGGIGTNTSVTARALARLGLATWVITRGRGGVRQEGAVTVIRLRHRRPPTHTARMLLALPARRRIAVATARLHPDVVQAPEWDAEAWWVARRGVIPVITRLATPTYLMEELNHGHPRRASALTRYLERDQARRSAIVFAPTRAIAERVGRDWDLPEVQVIPNAVDIAEVQRLGASEPPVALPNRSLVFIGRLERRKGVQTLGAALPRVLDAHPDVHVFAIGRDRGVHGGGAGDEFRRAVRPVADRVHLLGELPRAAALAMVARADVVVLPSLWESFGYVCVEAMALGRPVVASRTGGFAEMVEEGRTGWLVTPGDAEELAETLIEALGDRARLEAYGAAGRRRATEWDADRIVGQIVELYEAARWARGEGFDERIYERGYRRYFRPDDPRNPFQKLYEQKSRAVLDAIPDTPRLRILDVGGGYGRLAGPLSTHHDVVLCDVSPDMIEEALRRWPSLEVVRADARALPFEDESFDLVLAIDLVTHLPSLQEGINELARVVRPGGRVLLDTTNRSPWWPLAYPRYVGFRPLRLLRTMLAGGVLPEWRTLVRHDRPAEARAAIAATSLVLEDVRRFGPSWSPKWHLWLATRR
jgi:glycogen(starch) synthase